MDVVSQEHRFTRDQIEPAAQSDSWRSPGIPQERSANDDRQKDQDKQSALRISREGMDGGQDTGTHKERP